MFESPDRPALGVPGQGPNGSTAPAPFPQPEGPYYPSQEPSGFTAGAVWERQAKYNFTHYFKGNNATGTIPHPTQERINAFMEAGAMFEVEALRLQHEAAEATAKARAERRKAMTAAAEKGEEYVEPFDVEEAKKEAKAALAELHEMHDQMREHLAEFCKGHPTLASLKKLPDPEFRQFNNWVGSLINPEM